MNKELLVVCLSVGHAFWCLMFLSFRHVGATYLLWPIGFSEASQNNQFLSVFYWHSKNAAKGKKFLSLIILVCSASLLLIFLDFGLGRVS